MKPTMTFRAYIEDMILPEQEAPCEFRSASPTPIKCPLGGRYHSLEGGQGLPVGLALFIARRNASKFDDAPKTAAGVIAFFGDVKRSIMNEMRTE
jgi:hypothetical protein